MADHEQPPSSEELAALELYRQLLNISPDNGDRTLMVTLRLPSGRYVGDVWLSRQDVETAVDALITLGGIRADADPALAPATPLEEEPLPDDEEQIRAVGEEAERFLKNGGLL